MVVFLMFNYIMVWPHFKDWGVDKARIEKAQKQIAVYEAEIRHKDEYQRKINAFQTEGSSQVAEEDQAIDFVRFLSSRALNNQVVITSQGTLVTHTNDYSVDQQMGISVQAPETNLVNFLYALGSGSSMIRVRAMSLHPDQSHQQLTAGITIMASYQKKAKMRSGALPAGTTASAPTTAPAVKTPPPAPKPAPVADSKPKTNSPTGPAGLPSFTNRLAGALARRNRTNQPPLLTPQ
jgi:hypothetical protein